MSTDRPPIPDDLIANWTWTTHVETHHLASLRHIDRPLLIVGRVPTIFATARACEPLPPYGGTMTTPQRTITEHDIIAARKRVTAADVANELCDFADALLASPDLTPEMIKDWLDATANVQWCACETDDATPHIVCAQCGLPPFWTTRTQEER